MAAGRKYPYVNKGSENDLLVEKDSPYLSLNHSINSPACIGDIAHLVAAKMGISFEDVLSKSLENGLRLYKC